MLGQNEVRAACAHLKEKRHEVAASVREQVKMDATLTPFIGGSAVMVPSVSCS